MSPSGTPDQARARLVAQASHRCGYCRSSEQITGMPLVLDHLVPKALGGTDEEDNLWPACDPCNSYKQARIEARDPMTGTLIPLFNPRRQRWHDHFAWAEGGRLIVGRTPIGRATEAALHLNRPLLIAARALWITFGLHPPADED